MTLIQIVYVLSTVVEITQHLLSTLKLVQTAGGMYIAKSCLFKIMLCVLFSVNFAFGTLTKVVTPKVYNCISP